MTRILQRRHTIGKEIGFHIQTIKASATFSFRSRAKVARLCAWSENPTGKSPASDQYSWMETLPCALVKRPDQRLPDFHEQENISPLPVYERLVEAGRRKRTRTVDIRGVERNSPLALFRSRTICTLASYDAKLKALRR
ncbi:hypothetical protein [Brucella sp. JSBI001]|uniref:hypothetical protein n=1 Tax=Brucella sp. JSBI001 TaxID=2886044 RepID=UPI0022321ABA|nr:hypothetical protein LJ361_13860 [Brucella sp. JSBI001]